MSASNADPVYDVRVIRLVKSTQKNDLAWFYNRQGNCNICLGHFDVMWTETLSQGLHDPLGAIQSDSNIPWGLGCRGVDDQDEIPGLGEENFSYPLYILRQHSAENFQKSVDSLDKFWEKKTTYTVVTRFHCDTMEESDPFSELLVLRLGMNRNTDSGVSLSAGKVDGIGDIRVQVQFPGEKQSVETAVWVTFYDSLELGDIVGIAKGDSIAAILEVQRHLYESKWVSDAYTYCGIHKEYFQVDDNAFTQMLERDKQLLDCAHISYISTRFSVNHVMEAENYLNKIDEISGIRSDARFFVTGTADLIIDWSDRSETDFLKIMRCLVLSGSTMYSAFNDIITRVGLAHTTPIESRTTPPKKMDFACVVPQYHNVLNLLNDPNQRYTWAYQLLKLLGTLHTMYGNCVMDDLSALLVPGVSALLDRIWHLHSKGDWKDEYDREIFEFLDCWALLTNDISHLESQLVQHPELSPVRYFIPAMVLQYEQRCVRDCAKLLQLLDTEAGGQTGYIFAPILIPSTGENTSTRCILDPWHDTQYGEAAPLRILLPISKLYQPWKIAHILCHEVAHYCGSLVRCRGERLDCLIRSAAIYLLQLMDSCISFRHGANLKGKRRFLEQVEENIRRNYLNATESGHDYLSCVRENLPWAVWSVCEDPQIWDSYLDMYILNLPAEMQLQYASKLDGIGINMAAGLRQYCDDHIAGCLIPICKECYADIVMILLLDCSFPDYYACVFQDEYDRLSSKVAKPEDLNTLELYQQHIDRLALVSLVISGDSLKGVAWLPSLDQQTDRWPKEAMEKIEYWRKRTALINSGATQVEVDNVGAWPKPEALKAHIRVHDLSSNSVQVLLDYLNSCAAAVNSRIEKGSSNLIANRDQLQLLIGLTKETSFNWNEIRRLLQSPG